jgi:GGDEF domain-containing protein
MTTFDLFRNLFDRGLNAIFFLGEDLEQCVAANLRAEQMTGRTLYELQQIGLHDLVYPDQFDRTLKIIRRANRHYYDAKGITVLRDRLDRRREVAFSCGVFNFGRKSFVKIEIQDIAESAVKMKAFRPQPEASTTPSYDPVTKVLSQESFLRALDQNLSRTDKQRDSLSLVLCKIKPVESPTPAEDLSEEETNMFKGVAKILQDNIRQTDILARLSHYQFAILMPKTIRERANKLVVRLKAALESVPAFKSHLYEIEVEYAQCPEDAYPFMYLLRSAGNPSV